MTFFTKLKTYFTFPTFVEPHYKETTDMARASIITLNNGRFGLATSEGIVGSYARRRDAVRGANRRGLALAS